MEEIVRGDGEDSKPAEGWPGTRDFVKQKATKREL